MPRADLVERKVASASGRLDDALELASCDIDTFAGDARRADLASFYVFLAVQESIDLATYWIADAGWPPPDDTGGAFDTLAGRGAIPAELAVEMRAMVRFRNRIAHGYSSVDHRRMHGKIASGAAILRRFLACVQPPARG